MRRFSWDDTVVIRQDTHDKRLRDRKGEEAAVVAVWDEDVDYGLDYIVEFEDDLSAKVYEKDLDRSDRFPPKLAPGK